MGIDCPGGPGEEDVLKNRGLALALVVALSAAVALTVAATPAFATHGCTPGFWKNRGLVLYNENLTVGATIGHAAEGGIGAPFGGDALLEALQYGGGPGIDGARQIMLRAAVASYLNASLFPAGVWPGPTVEGIRLRTTDFYNEGTRAEMLAWATELDAYNNGADGCFF